jgi:hypothetical protein
MGFNIELIHAPVNCRVAELEIRRRPRCIGQVISTVKTDLITRTPPVERATAGPLTLMEKLWRSVTCSRRWNTVDMGIGSSSSSRRVSYLTLLAGNQSRENWDVARWVKQGDARHTAWIKSHEGPGGT